MDLSILTSQKLIVLNSNYTSKMDVIKELIRLLYLEGKITDEKVFYDAVMDREKISPTGIDQNIAIPHGKSSCVKECAFAAMTLTKPILSWESVAKDNEVRYIFLLAIPEDDKDGQQMKLLSELMKKVSDSNYRDELFSSKTQREFYEHLKDTSSKQTLDEKRITNKKSEYEESYLVAVTACTSGIAHTYLAAEALEKAADELGITIFVEKQGANGIDGRLEYDLIQHAKAAILTIDVDIEGKERFDSIPKIETRVSSPIKDAKKLIKEAMLMDNDRKTKDSFMRILFQASLTGVSNIGILFLFLGIIMLIGKFLNGSDFLVSMTKLLEFIVYPIFSGFMAKRISDKQGFGVGILAGAVSFYLDGGVLLLLIGGILSGFFVLSVKKLVVASNALSGIYISLIYPMISGVTVIISLIAMDILFEFLGIYGLLNIICSFPIVIFLINSIIGVTVIYDLGGSVNKTGYLISMLCLIQGWFIPYSVFAAVKVLSNFSTFIFMKIKRNADKRFDDLWIYGLTGITEKALPFLEENKKIARIGWGIGAIVCALLITYFKIGLFVPGAGIFSIVFLIGDLNSVMIWLGSVILGTFVSLLIFILNNKKILTR